MADHRTTSKLPIVIGAVVFLWALADVVLDGPLRHWDRTALMGAQPPAHQPLGWRLVSDIGGPWVLTVALVGAAIVHLLRRRTVQPLIRAAVCLVALEATIWLAKATIGRSAPRSQVDELAAHGMSFPSGHTAGSFALLTIAAALVVPSGTRLATFTAWFIPVISAVVGVSTVVLHFHWPTDVMAGWGLGLVAATLIRSSVAQPDVLVLRTAR
ncbi:phosphatase PAP2 family protein [Kribbella sp. NPDC004536]|uniref:phosphatase PAP2 family protein n=1 Tax=Kribbella sp. NPDC004536 TaxID=3364106 RepID=UPI0036A6B37E